MAEGLTRDLSVVCGQYDAAFSFDGISGSIGMSDLYYEGSVIQFEQVELAGAQTDANGQIYFWRKKAPVVFTISVFPGSKTDISLSNAMEACLSDVGEFVEIKSGRIKYSNGIEMTFSNGAISSWMPGANANGDNRIGPKTYRFVFEKAHVTSKG